ncbi:HTH-type transcriptional repressor NsrR (fragment) [Sinorhizobium medicae]|uniref:HTH-type transcriptional repressor NsrR n=2 Tax=Sinorhizobium medicae TaxID=110321 RepID=A0A508WPH5_9HYPH
MKLRSQVEHRCCLLMIGSEHGERPPTTSMAALVMQREYLSKNLQALSSTGITGSRGMFGGYRLAHHPDAIKLLEIVKEFGGNFERRSLAATSLESLALELGLSREGISDPRAVDA